MKPLLPTLKEKKRYVVYELLTRERVAGSPEREILTHLRNTLGLFDAAAAGILPVQYDGKRQAGILRVSTRSLDKVRGAFLLLKSVERQRVVPRIIGVSGTLAGARRFLPNERTIMNE